MKREVTRDAVGRHGRILQLLQQARLGLAAKETRKNAQLIQCVRFMLVLASLRGQECGDEKRLNKNAESEVGQVRNF